MPSSLSTPGFARKKALAIYGDWIWGMVMDAKEYQLAQVYTTSGRWPDDMDGADLLQFS